MAKKVTGVVKLQLPAGKATPAPPVGPALGGYGINIMAFVKEYNEKTSSQAGSVIPVEITVYSDRSFTIVLKNLCPPPTCCARPQASIKARASRTATWLARSRASSCASWPSRKCRISTPLTSKEPKRSWPAPPAVWASQLRNKAQGQSESLRQAHLLLPF